MAQVIGVAVPNTHIKKEGLGNQEQQNSDQVSLGKKLCVSEQKSSSDDNLN